MSAQASGHEKGPAKRTGPGYVSGMKIAAAVVLFVAALAKLVAASDGRYWFLVRGTHNAKIPSEGKAQSREKLAEKIVDRANLAAYLLGVVAAGLALFALD